MKFSREEHWSGLPCPPPGDLLNPGIKPTCPETPALAITAFTTAATWEASNSLTAAKLLQLCPTLCGPHRQQPNSLPNPWGSPGKNTGVGCHFLLQCMKMKSESEVAQSCLTLSDPMDHSLQSPSIHGIFQARVLEWGAIAFSKFSYY